MFSFSIQGITLGPGDTQYDSSKSMYPYYTHQNYAILSSFSTIA